MQITELFTIELEEALKKNPHGDLNAFLPDSHNSLPDIQENLLYICASGHRIINQMEQYAFSGLNAYMFLYVRKGEGALEITGDHCRLAQNDLLFWDCSDYIQLRSLSSEWHIDLLFFNGAAVTTYYEEICKMSFPLFCLPEDTISWCHLTEAMALGSAATPHHAFLEHKLLTNLLSDLISSVHMTTAGEKTAPAYISELQRLFSKACQEDYSMDELASRFRVNRYRLTREFAHFVGMTPLKYLNNIRIEQARALLEATDLSVGAVGTAVGIPNATHFINLFKKKMGVTPQNYRDSYRSFREIR